MHYLLRALNSSTRVAVPSSRLIRRRWYSVAPEPPNTPQDEDFPVYEPPPPTPITKRLKMNQPLLGLERKVPKGVKATNTKLSVKIDATDRALTHIMLRDSCQCPRCVDPHSKQRKFLTGDIKVDVRPRSIAREGKTLEIKWENDIPGFDESHVSTYNIDDLAYLHPNPVRSNSGKLRSRMLWDQQKMKSLQHWITYDDYMNNERKFVKAMRHLALTGLIFLKDIPDSRDEVEKIATKMGPIRNTFYGATWDVRSVPQAKNVAYTNQDLGFHMDLMYMQNPPGYQLLHCLENASVGGESMFLDSFRVAHDIFATDRTMFDQLANLRLSYEYNHEDHVYSHQWPVFHVAPNSTNKLSLEHVNYSPPFQSRMLEKNKYPFCVKAVGSLKYLDEHLKDEARIFERKLQPGECAIFENRRVLHARRPFDLNGGNRWLAGTYVDEDALLSKFKTLSRKYPETWHQYHIYHAQLDLAKFEDVPEVVRFIPW